MLNKNDNHLIFCVVLWVQENFEKLSKHKNNIKDTEISCPSENQMQNKYVYKKGAMFYDCPQDRIPKRIN